MVVKIMNGMCPCIHLHALSPLAGYGEHGFKVLRLSGGIHPRGKPRGSLPPHPEIDKVDSQKNFLFTDIDLSRFSLRLLPTQPPQTRPKGMTDAENSGIEGEGVGVGTGPSRCVNLAHQWIAVGDVCV